MSSVPASSASATSSPPVKPGELRLEVVVLPVSNVDRAKRFYEALGWRRGFQAAERKTHGHDV